MGISQISKSQQARYRTTQYVNMINANINALHAYRFGGGDPYGPEMHTDANAASDPNGNEANATTGWAGASNVLVTSVSDPVNVGSYALKVESNTTPTTNARGYKLFTCVIGNTYFFSVDARHVGTGLGYRISIDGNTVALLVNTDLTYQTYTLEFVAVDTAVYAIAQENSSSNNGGVYMDNISLKEVL